MRENVDFVICALALMTLLFARAWARRRIANANARIFRLMLGIGVAETAMELVCELLIRASRPRLTGLLLASLGVRSMLQLTLPMAFFAYGRSLRPIHMRDMRRMMLLGVVPALTAFLVATALVFRAPGVREWQSIRIVVEVNAALYMAATAAVALRHRAELGKKKLLALLGVAMLVSAGILFQIVEEGVLTASFGFSMGATLLSLTINNPHGCIDNLTGVFDKPYFEQWIDEEMAQGGPIHLLAVDLFTLRRINKNNGSAMGDKLLLRAAKEMRGYGGHTLVFRLTGKRFALVTRSLFEYELCRSQLQLYFGGFFDVDGETVQLPALVCGITNAEKLKSSDLLLGYIDHLVSLAPQPEKTTLVQSSQQTLEGYHYRLEVESYLADALENERFEVYYQPVYSLRSGGYVTLEALSRLKHPTLGPVPPDLFVDLAEKNGQIVELGYQQFKKVCRFMRDNPDILAKIDHVKFNLSPSELLKYGYGRTLIDTIRAYELPFDRFQFEITETVATEYSKELDKVIREFVDAGIRLCLDDFGSGYANLNAVLRLPFSCVKLDRSMLYGLCEDEQVARFYQNMVSVLQNLGYCVVSEGVESEREKELIASFGVDMVQGYYFSAPLSEEELRQTLLGEGL